jgi:rod shape determining protein RodA
MAIDRRLLKHFDWPLLAVVLGIVAVGLPVMYSASIGREGSSEVFTSHLVRLAIGLTVMCLAAAVDYHRLVQYSPLLYLFNVGTLLMTAAAGIVGLGARRWLQIGPVSIQPSELTKITIILTLALFIAGVRQASPLDAPSFGLALALFGVPFLLVLRQPDLGTAGIIMLIAAVMIAATGLTRALFRSLAKLLISVAAVGLIVWATGLVGIDDILHPYQLRRITVLVHPELDPLGASYHINQSKIAIGSGGMVGKGFLNGTQNQLRFLPQQHTDFIFSVLAEEWGFVGVGLVLSLYLFLFLLALRTAVEARDRVGSLVALGVTALIFFHTSINIAMTTGLFPVVGIPLPLLSYGGSSFMVVMCGIGLLLNVRMRRFSA